MKGQIDWLSENVILDNRILLFCIGEKCMSGRVINCQSIEGIHEFEIFVSFIEPDYFVEDLVLGNSFTIREASKVIAKGFITGLL
jgi:hypothetical protein